jgi:hypothetical protein
MNIYSMNQEELFRLEMKGALYLESEELEVSLLSGVRKTIRFVLSLAIVSMLSTLLLVAKGYAGYDWEIRASVISFVIFLMCAFFVIQHRIKGIKANKVFQVRTIAVSTSRSALAFIDHTNHRFCLVRYWMI